MSAITPRLRLATREREYSAPGADLQPGPTFGERALISALGDVVLVVTTHGMCRDFYATDDSRLPAPAERLSGRHVREIFAPAVAAKFLRAIEQHSTSSSPAQFAFAVDRDRERRHYETRVIRIDPHFLFALNDVTSRLRAEALEREVERLQTEMIHSARHHLVGRMATSLVHELCQPLCAILLNAESARISLPSDPRRTELSEIVDDIGADARRAKELVSRLRAFLTNGDQIRECVAVERVVEDASHILRQVFLRDEVAFSIELAPSLPRVQADPAQLQQVLVNLLFNATESVRRNPIGRRRVRIGARPIDSRVEITVTDSGRGFAARELAELFKPCRSRKPGGMGLGLSICRDIIEAHGGQITAGNGKHSGAVLRISLPIAAGSFEPPPSERSLTSEEFDRIGARLIIAELDAAEIRLGIAQMRGEPESSARILAAARDALRFIDRFLPRLSLDRSALLHITARRNALHSRIEGMGRL